MSNRISKMIHSRYTLNNLEELHTVLVNSGAFKFDRFPSGLFPAVGRGTATELTSGYRAVWIRDNIHIAYAHLACGDVDIAVHNVCAVAAFLEGQHRRFMDVIDGRKDPKDPMNRPHIRFDGETCAEILERWPHAQNDALGAFLWLYSILILRGDIPMDKAHAALLADFIRYFRAVEYWEDEDSGHWEETRKISASSIGAIVAGLKAARDLTRAQTDALCALTDEIDALIDRGVRALEKILPSECVQEHPDKKRRTDAALLFLIDPFDAVNRETADCIIHDVESNLKNESGIARYLGDSYWGPDYRNIPPEKRTIDLSEDIIQRSDYSVPGMEARWTIFDPVLSVIFGKRFRETFDEKDLSRQTEYLNRSLSQLVESPSAPQKLLLPEAYFVENGKYVPNDHMPLQWAHANLRRAIFSMEESLKIAGPRA